MARGVTSSRRAARHAYEVRRVPIEAFVGAVRSYVDYLYELA